MAQTFVTNRTCKPTDPTDFDVRCAERLSVAVRLRNKVHRPIRIATWAPWFRKLRTVGRVSEADVTTALDWYCRNIGGKYVPQAFSGEAFYTKFEAITAAVERDRERVAKTTPKQVSDEAAEVARGIAMTMSWPKGSKSQLPEVVEESLTNVRQFIKDLREIRAEDAVKPRPYKEVKRALLESDRWNTPPRYKTLSKDKLHRDKLHREVKKAVRGFYKTRCDMFYWNIDRLMSMFSGGVQAFVDRWYAAVNKRVLWWEEWSGNLHYFTFRPDHPDFDRMVLANGVVEPTWNAIKEIVREKPNPQGA